MGHFIKIELSFLLGWKGLLVAGWVLQELQMIGVVWSVVVGRVLADDGDGQWEGGIGLFVRHGSSWLSIVSLSVLSWLVAGWCLTHCVCVCSCRRQGAGWQG